jgi:hypothetical protein
LQGRVVAVVGQLAQQELSNAGPRDYAASKIWKVSILSAGDPVGLRDLIVLELSCVYESVAAK